VDSAEARSRQLLINHHHLAQHALSSTHPLKATSSTAMSLTRSSTSLSRLTQTLGQRYASTAGPTSSYPRKTSTPVRKASTPSTPSRASISSTPKAPAAANDLPPPPPSFEEISGLPRAASTPASSASKFSRPTPGQTPPAPLTTFPDENYPGLPNVEGADWSTSFSGLSAQPFDEKAAAILLKPVTPDEIEVKPGMSLSPVSAVCGKAECAQLTSRWYPVHARNPISASFESGVRTWRLGTGTSRWIAYHRSASYAGMGFGVSRSVSSTLTLTPYCLVH
jgi:hypothetical protein